MAFKKVLTEYDWSLNSTKNSTNLTTSIKHDDLDNNSTDEKKENCEKLSCMKKKLVENNHYANFIHILCMLRHWELPNYDFFTNVVAHNAGNKILHIAICSTMIYKSMGYGRSKKVAKNEAARKMYDQIINLSNDEIDNVQYNHKVAETNFDVKKQLQSITSHVILKIIRKFLDRLQLSDNPSIKNLKKLNSLENNSAVEMLKTIAAEEDFTLTYFVREKITDVGIRVELHIIESIMFVGIGVTTARAKELAAFSALMYIKLMS